MTMTLEEFIDATSMGARQRLVVALAFLTMVAEGLDITIASFLYPQIVKDWGTSIGAVTFTVTMGVLSMAIGGAIAGPLADRYGRKLIAIAGILLFSLATAAMGLAKTIEVLATLRIVACAGLGAVMPVVMAIVADSIPSTRRAQMVTLTFSGVAAGTIVGGFLSSSIIPEFGWPTLMAICGLAPLVLVPAIAIFIPESVSVLIARGRTEEHIRKALALLAPGRDTSPVELTAQPTTEPPPSVGAIVLSRRLMLTTVLIWICYFVGLGVVFLVLNYLPLMVEQSGFTAAESGVIVAMFGWGGLVGQLLVSFILRRFDRFRILALLWALGALAVWIVAAFSFGFSGFIVAVFALGLTLPSANAALQAISALAYPAAARATGMGWTSGVGRLGTLTSGLLGGLMIGAGWSISRIFLVLGIPIALGVGAVLALRADTRHRENGSLSHTAALSDRSVTAARRNDFPERASDR
ncbi:MFS transporter [Rhodococcus opacus]|uniref:MFS transporter n=1 Tax=Rhodococcus opacus TaxID=37919 RepID=UPI002235920C|nr:aromatic acid/H+ symport family MFS transporter [Rhodococcus opacus]UZG55084.1 aromatic acid/H+ symport family MFS transporter [Rhodococcus opacus]